MGWLNNEGLAHLWAAIKTYVANASSGTSISDLEGFRAKTTVFNSNGNIVETDEDGNVKTTIFNSDGTITQTFYDGKTTITKNTIFYNGEIKEEVVQ